MIKNILSLLLLSSSSLAFAAPSYSVITGGQAEQLFDSKLAGVMTCNGNTCSWTKPDQVSQPNAVVTTCSAKVKWTGGAGTEKALEGTAICLESQLD